MAQAPAVVIIARHGMRLDAADQTWHLSTPAPYDPPLTYGGWNQSRALGARIASLLHTREQQYNNAADAATTTSQLNDGETPSKRRRRRKHRVVIHSSPFLRCLQTSVAIAAGLALFATPTAAAAAAAAAATAATAANASVATSAIPRAPPARYRTAAQLYSATSAAKLRGGGGHESYASTPLLAPIVEPSSTLGSSRRQESALTSARRGPGEPHRCRRTQLRVDPFLGEWLNPAYFDHITPPPPSAMMLASAKAELWHHETVDTYTPNLGTANANGGVLWGANGTSGRATGGGTTASSSKESSSALDDWSPLHDVLTPSSLPHRRGRANSASSTGSNDSGAAGRKSPFRPGHVLAPQASVWPAAAASVAYVPPTPGYAIAPSERIPRGYVAHARQACVDVDMPWDSSRSPRDWGDGGELGEEWSGMHRRFRKGVNRLVEWYGRCDATSEDEGRGEDALGIEQADRQAPAEDEEEKGVEKEQEEEDLVVILVTHGAGCNALIGALTQQPVLLDVGMASLTMAVRRADAPPLPGPPAASMSAAQSPADSHATSPTTSPEPVARTTHYGASRRRSSLDIGLGAIYEMKIVSSSEHLRPGVDPTKVGEAALLEAARSNIPTRNKHHSHKRFGSSGVDSISESSQPRPENVRSNNTSTALGSIRRPSLHGNYPSRQNSGARQSSFSSSGGLPLHSSPPLSPPPHNGRPVTQNFSVDDMPVFTTSVGLWQPPSFAPSSNIIRHSPAPETQQQQHGGPVFTPPTEERRRPSIRHNSKHDFSNSPPDSRSASPHVTWDGAADAYGYYDSTAGAAAGYEKQPQPRDSVLSESDTHADATSAHANTTDADADDALATLRTVTDCPPTPLRRGLLLSQKGLWGSQPDGMVARRFADLPPKRRWTVEPNAPMESSAAPSPISPPGSPMSTVVAAGGGGHFGTGAGPHGLPGWQTGAEQRRQREISAT